MTKSCETAQCHPVPPNFSIVPAGRTALQESWPESCRNGSAPAVARPAGDEIERGQRDGTTREEHAEIVKLRREVRRLEKEKLILQKVAAYFARETGRLP